MLRLWTLAAAVLTALLAPQAALTQSVARPNLDDVVQRAIDETNAFRRAQGYAATSPNATLAATAQ